MNGPGNGHYVTDVNGCRQADADERRCIRAQEKYLLDVPWAIHRTKAGRWYAFDRKTGDSVGEYDSEGEARAAIRAKDVVGMIRINMEKIVGGPTFDQLKETGLAACREFLRLHPRHVGAINVISQMEQEAQAKRRSIARAKRTAIQDGMTKSRWSPSGPRCPTKRELR